MDEQDIIENLAEAITAARGHLDNPKAYRDRVRVTIEARYAEYGQTWLLHEAKRYGVETGVASAAPVRMLPVECGLCGMHISPAALLNPKTTNNEHGYPVTSGRPFKESADTCSLARSIVTQIRDEESSHA